MKAPAMRKVELISSLPVYYENLGVRIWCRKDLDIRADWPPYPSPYSVFTSGVGGMTPSQRDSYFRERDTDLCRITLTVDHANQIMIGMLALFDIDWGKDTVGNMGVRIHPEWCDRGIGTTVMGMVASWLFDAGIREIRLDVAEPNVRAIRCYEKAGFSAGEKFVRDGVPFLWMSRSVI